MESTNNRSIKRLSLVAGHVNANKTAWVMKNITPLEFFPKGDLKGKTLFISGASRGKINRFQILSFQSLMEDLDDAPSV
jgi:hypothetical protein